MICHIIAPIYLLLVIISVDAIAKHINDTYNEHPKSYALGDFPNCDLYKRTKTCTTIGYGVLGDVKPWVNSSM